MTTILTDRPRLWHYAINRIKICIDVSLACTRHVHTILSKKIKVHYRISRYLKGAFTRWFINKATITEEDEIFMKIWKTERPGTNITWNRNFVERMSNRFIVHSWMFRESIKSIALSAHKPHYYVLIKKKKKKKKDTPRILVFKLRIKWLFIIYAESS